MGAASRLSALWRNLTRRAQVDRELDAEVRAAFDLLADERMRAGMSPAEARRVATLEWGRPEYVSERVRETRSGGALSRIGTDLLRDVRIAARGLARRPVFTAVALVTLALGIGANTAIFSVVRAVLLRPLPYESPERLLQIRGFYVDTGSVGNLSPGDMLDLARDATTLEGIAAHGFIGPATVSGADLEAERVGRVQIGGPFFETLGVRPALGRLFTPEEDRAGGPSAALLTDGYWRRRFAADPAVVGRSINVNAVPTTIIGVLPPSFRHAEENVDRPVDMFTSYQFDAAQPNRGGHFLRGVGRLRAGLGIDDARAELATIAARLEREYPQTNADQSILVRPLQEAMVGPARPTVLLLWAAVAVVLLVVCANMANLLLAAGGGRQRELAVRAAIGAGRGRLVRQLVAESVVLGLLGAAAGVAVAVAARPALGALAAAGIPRLRDAGIDWTVLGFAAAIAVVASLAFGLVPALVLSRGDLHEGLRQGGRQAARAVHRRAREALILAEVALSVILLVSAGLLVETLWRLQSVAPGFDEQRGMVMNVTLPSAGYRDGAQIDFVERLEERVRALPGIRHVGSVNILPLSGNYDSRGVRIDDDPDLRPPSPQARSVTPAYFQAMGIPLVRGRFFGAGDRADSPLVVIVSDSMARQAWPGQEAIGRRLTFNGGIPEEQAQDVGGAGSREVVGVVGDVKHASIAEGPVPMFYTPHAQPPSSAAMSLVVRADSDPAGLVPAIRSELATLDPDVPLAEVRSLDQVVSRALSASEMRAQLVGLFAILALALAAVGVYGVVAFLVGQRAHEIGVRLALGAPPSSVLAMIVRDGMRPVALGVLIGAAGALAVSRLLQAMLFGVSGTDLTAYVVACGGLAVAGLLATLVPARRALAMDPVAALRGD